MKSLIVGALWWVAYALLFAIGAFVGITMGAWWVVWVILLAVCIVRFLGWFAHTYIRMF